MDNAVDALLVAAAGALDPEQLRAMAANVEHLAQLLDETVEAEEAYRAAKALRGFADSIEGET